MTDIHFLSGSKEVLQQAMGGDPEIVLVISKDSQGWHTRGGKKNEDTLWPYIEMIGMTELIKVELITRHYDEIAGNMEDKP